MAVADALTSVIFGVGFSLIQLIVSLFLAIGSVYLALRMFDKSTKGIDEMKEVKKGNIAVGLFMAVFVISIASIVQVGVSNLTSMVSASSSPTAMLVGLLIGVVQLLIGILAAVVSINIAIMVLDKITIEFEEYEELKKGNVAVALLMSGVLLAVTFVIRAGVEGLAHAVDPVTLAMSLGL